jgi:hypothetical protein
MFGITQQECDSPGCGLSEAILVSEHLPECPKSGCEACYEQGQRDALAAAVQPVEALWSIDPSWDGTNWNNALHAAIAAIKGDQ